MKFKLLFALITTIAISSHAVDFKQPIVVNDKTVVKHFQQLLPSTVIDKIYTTPYPDTYALIVGVNIVYANLHTPYLMAGHMFNVYTQQDITTQLQKQIAPKIDISKININDAVVSKAKHKVNKKLIIFMDPDCPYCRQLEQQISQQHINDKADIYYMLMPLPMHKDAKAHSMNILCSTTPLATLNEYMNNGNDNPQVKLLADCNIDATSERIGSTARSLNIHAAPTIITGDGVMIMGSDTNAIQEYLNK